MRENAIHVFYCPHQITSACSNTPHYANLKHIMAYPGVWEISLEDWQCKYVVPLEMQLTWDIFQENILKRCEVRYVIRNATCIWRDFGSALPFQIRLTQTKPVLPLPNEHGSPVKDQSRWQCCHAKHKKFPYRPTRDVSLLYGHAS
jgi:hypothetical protein